MGTSRRPRSRLAGWVVPALLAATVVAVRAADPDVGRQGPRPPGSSSSSRRSGRCWPRSATRATAPAKQKGGLRLDSREAILKGGETGPAVVPGKPEESLLVEAVNYDGLEMPPTGKLEPDADRHPDALGRARRPLASARPPACERLGRGCQAVDGSRRAQRADRSLWSLQPLRPPANGRAGRRCRLDPDDPWSDWPRNSDRSLRPQGAAGEGPDPGARGRPARP